MTTREVREIEDLLDCMERMQRVYGESFMELQQKVRERLRSIPRKEPLRARTRDARRLDS